ncbi:hypothetical protein [Roseicella aerolata]|uniref:Uncharacterized protein n=1 Tax=Roseicella aerolata TaxID=2883479 RepID=A0A9X1IDI2_9PROT|nr:hypothetical protein [Roseicella aerolata]MCB4822771.1 hypothetical protein [Roseicella aerolata]
MRLRPPRHPLLALAVALGCAAGSGVAAAQPGAAPAPDTSRAAPPEAAPARPQAPAPSPRDRAGGGPTGDDTVESHERGGIARGVIRPRGEVDPGIHRGTVPDPSPGTTPVIPPPGTPGGDPTVQPR